jgi:hypothetical protein
MPRCKSPHRVRSALEELSATTRSAVSGPAMESLRVRFSTEQFASLRHNFRSSIAFAMLSGLPSLWFQY